MMAAQPPPGGGDAPDSRDQVDGGMDVELALSTHALLSKQEEREDSESHPGAGMQELFSSNAEAEGSAWSNLQTQEVAVTPVNTVPLAGGAG